MDTDDLTTPDSVVRAEVIGIRRLGMNDGLEMPLMGLEVLIRQADLEASGLELGTWIDIDLGNR